jgi:hypothetical protein
VKQDLATHKAQPLKELLRTFLSLASLGSFDIVIRWLTGAPGVDKTIERPVAVRRKDTATSMDTRAHLPLNNTSTTSDLLIIRNTTTHELDIP